MVGILAIINSTLVIASVFSLFGTTSSVLRMVPEYSQQYSQASAAIVIRRMAILIAGISPIVSIILASGFFAWIKLFPENSIQIQPLLITALFLPLFSLSKFYTEALRALQKTRIYAIAHILPSLSNLLLLGILLLLGGFNDLPIWAFFVSAILVFSTTGVLVLKYLPRIPLQDNGIPKPAYRELISISLPMGITAGLLLFISNFDTLLLGFLRTEAETGIYSITQKLSLLTGFVIASINAVSAPQFSELYFSNKKQELLSLAIKSSRLIFWASLPILIALMVGGKFFLGFFGQEFISGYPILIILVAKEFINAAGGSVGYYQNMTGSHIQFRNIVIIAVLLNIVLNLILIPRYGILGAAITSLFTTLFWNLTSSILIYRQTGRCISYIPTPLRKRLNI
jgi:O-antigen/teichoic acid export membrane protein